MKEAQTPTNPTSETHTENNISSVNLLQELYDAYDLPDNAPSEVQSISKERYKHPEGVYLGFIGQLRPKYKNLDGKYCESTDPGAVCVRYTLDIYLKKYFGPENAPTSIEIMGNDLKLDPNKSYQEYYFPLSLDIAPNQVWKIEQLFSGFQLKGIDADTRIVVDNPNPQIKYKQIKFVHFKYYFGMHVKLSIVHSKAGNPYIKTIALVDAPRVSINKMVDLVEAIKQKIETEREQRKSELDAAENTNLPQQRSASDILSSSDEDMGEYSDEDLPF